MRVRSDHGNEMSEHEHGVMRKKVGEVSNKFQIDEFSKMLLEKKARTV